jgi:hypothetical protein
MDKKLSKGYHLCVIKLAFCFGTILVPVAQWFVAAHSQRGFKAG